MTKLELALKIAQQIEQLRQKAAAASIFNVKEILEEMGQKQAQFNLLVLEVIGNE